jgi:hypothetical protein
LVGVENNKVAAQDVFVGRVKGVFALRNLMLDAKEVLVRVASDWSTSYKQKYLSVYAKFVLVLALWLLGEFGNFERKKQGTRQKIALFTKKLDKHLNFHIEIQYLNFKETHARDLFPPFTKHPLFCAESMLHSRYLVSAKHTFTKNQISEA